MNKACSTLGNPYSVLTYFSFTLLQTKDFIVYFVTICNKYHVVANKKSYYIPLSNCHYYLPQYHGQRSETTVPHHFITFFSLSQTSVMMEKLRTQVANHFWNVPKYTYDHIRKHVCILFISQKAIKILASNTVQLKEHTLNSLYQHYDFEKHTELQGPPWLITNWSFPESNLCSLGPGLCNLSPHTLTKASCVHSTDHPHLLLTHFCWRSSQAEYLLASGKYSRHSI